MSWSECCSSSSSVHPASDLNRGEVPRKTLVKWQEKTVVGFSFSLILEKVKLNLQVFQGEVIYLIVLARRRAEVVVILRLQVGVEY